MADSSKDRPSFKRREDVSDWLQSKPRDWSVALAARAALRALPLVFGLGVERDNSAPLFLAVFRASSVAWISSRSGDYAESLIATAVVSAQGAAATGDNTTDEAAKGAARAAASAAAARASADASARSDSYTAAAAAAANAADAAATAVRAAAIATDAKGVARAAAYAAASAYTDVVWGAITADAVWLASGRDAAALLDQPLWLIDVREEPRFQVNFPLWAREPFDAFDESDWVAIGPWGVWLAWYRALLSGPERSRLFTDRRMFEIASQQDAFWQRDPHRVTANVAALVGWKWNESEWIWPGEVLEDSRPSQSLLERSPPLSDASSAPVIETVGVHSDEPTAVDKLHRRPFAKAIVERLDDVFAQNGVDGFAVHIHAPWGSGKSSVLQMMRQYLETAGRENKGAVVPRWVVVNFDAWKNERRNPPWWPLVQELRASCIRYTRIFNEAGSVRLKWDWFWWKIRTDFLPYIVGVLVGGLSIFVLWYTGGQSSSSNPLELLLKIVTAAAAVMASFIGASRIAMFGSSTNAKFYEDISQDPLRRVRALFEKVVDATNAPICIFVEDLDRCRPDYVIGLLQGIQTVFRHKSVAYIVAADRSWMKASFENQYKDIKDEVGTPSQPLGYLFLEKVFQMSVPLPAVDAKTRAEYWSALLSGDAAEHPRDGARNVSPVSEVDVDAERADIRSKNENLTREAAEEILKQNDTPVMREALALELSSSQAVATEATHLLAEFKDCVPEIPRVMKRMINAYAIRYAMGFMAGTNVPVKMLARWTIIEQSAPALADALTIHPDWVEEGAQIPTSNPFFDELRSKRFRAIVGTGDDRLTTGHIRIITRGDEIAGTAATQALP